jgi:hypothetical protein
MPRELRPAERAVEENMFRNISVRWRDRKESACWGKVIHGTLATTILETYFNFCA